MAKRSGLGMALYVAGYDLSGDITALDNVKGGPNLLECTAIDKNGIERVGGLFSGLLGCTSWFNPSAGTAHDRFNNLPTTDQLVSARIGTSLGQPSVDLLAKQVGYDANRANDGALTFKVEGLSSAGYPLEWGVQLTAGKRIDSTATNGTGVDGTASSAFGLAAYLHVFAFAGTSVTVKIQHSSDNGSGDPYADVTGAAFTAATGITFQRVQTANNLTIKRWLRAVTTGTFSNAVFSCSVVRHLTAVQ